MQCFEKSQKDLRYLDLIHLKVCLKLDQTDSLVFFDAGIKYHYNGVKKALDQVYLCENWLKHAFWKVWL